MHDIIFEIIAITFKRTKWLRASLSSLLITGGMRIYCTCGLALNTNSLFIGVG